MLLVRREGTLKTFHQYVQYYKGILGNMRGMKITKQLEHSLMGMGLC